MSRIWGREMSGAAGSLRLSLFVFGILLSCVPLLTAQSDQATAFAKSAEEFFIISSVDIAKKQLLLKEPTEITELLQLNDKTRCTDKNGKAIHFADLRAGDTVYIRSTATPAGKVAASIRKGPMTLQELQRRYLK